MMGDRIGGGVVDSYQGVGAGTGGGYCLIVFLFVLFSFGVSCPIYFSIQQNMIAIVSVCLFIICFLCLCSL